MSLRRAALTGAVGVLLLSGCSAVRPNGSSGVVQRTPLSESVLVSQPFCAASDEEQTTTTTTSSTERRDATARAVPPVEDRECGPFSGYSFFNGGPSYARFTSDGASRLLVAVQVADGTPDPTLALRRRPDVRLVKDDAVLTKLPPADAGRRWVGYRSDEVRYELDAPNAGDVVDATIPIVRDGDRPSSPEVVTRVFIGAQVTLDGFGTAYDANRAVNCDEDLDVDGDVSTTACPALPTGTDTGTVTSIVPTDAAITAPADEIAVDAGGTATVPFAVRQSGTVPEDADLALGATTTVPGADATPATTSIPWETAPPVETTTDARAATRAAGDAATDVPVTVTVPASTASGVYDVVLRAADEGGERSATARIRVTGQAPTTPPTSTTTTTTTDPVPPTGTLPSTSVHPGALVLGKASTSNAGRIVRVAAKVSGPGTIESIATRPAAIASTRARDIVRNVLKPGPRRLAYARLRPVSTKSRKLSLVLKRTPEGRLAALALGRRRFTVRIVVRYTPVGGKAIVASKLVRVTPPR
jgi:hypothetical protein